MNENLGVNPSDPISKVTADCGRNPVSQQPDFENLIFHFPFSWMYEMISSPVRSVHLMASLAGILLMTLWERLQETRLVFCINMKIASGTCCSWQSDKSVHEKMSLEDSLMNNQLW